MQPLRPRSRLPLHRAGVQIGDFGPGRRASRPPGSATSATTRASTAGNPHRPRSPAVRHRRVLRDRRSPDGDLPPRLRLRRRRRRSGVGTGGGARVERGDRPSNGLRCSSPTATSAARGAVLDRLQGHGPANRLRHAHQPRERRQRRAPPRPRTVLGRRARRRASTPTTTASSSTPTPWAGDHRRRRPRGDGRPARRPAATSTTPTCRTTSADWPGRPLRPRSRIYRCGDDFRDRRTVASASTETPGAPEHSAAPRRASSAPRPMPTASRTRAPRCDPSSARAAAPIGGQRRDLLAVTDTPDRHRPLRPGRRRSWPRCLMSGGNLCLDIANLQRLVPRSWPPGTRRPSPSTSPDPTRVLHDGWRHRPLPVVACDTLSPGANLSEGLSVTWLE